MVKQPLLSVVAVVAAALTTNFQFKITTTYAKGNIYINNIDGINVDTII